MRSEFEKIEDIKERLKLCYFDREQNSYLPHSQFDYGSASYLRGGWLIYQHQQSKVDELKNRLDAAMQEIFKCRVARLDRIYALDLIEQALKGGES